MSFFTIRARLKPQTMIVTFEEFSPTHDFLDYKASKRSAGQPVNLRLALGVRPSQSNSVCVAFFLLFGSCGVLTFIGRALLRNTLFRVCLRLCRDCSGFRGFYCWDGHVFLLFA